MCMVHALFCLTLHLIRWPDSSSGNSIMENASLCPMSLRVRNSWAQMPKLADPAELREANFQTEFKKGPIWSRKHQFSNP